MFELLEWWWFKLWLKFAGVWEGMLDDTKCPSGQFIRAYRAAEAARKPGRKR